MKQGLINQYLNLEVILPKMLNAIRINESLSSFGSTESNIYFKDQKVGNCTKASPLTAIKMAVYLKELEDGASSLEAGLMAKDLGDRISIELRKKSIELVKTLCKGSELDSDSKEKLISYIKKAEEKVRLKELSKFSQILNGSDIEELKRIVETTAEKEQHIADEKEDNPLLLLIAKQRKNLGSRWSPDNLGFISIKFDRCKNLFKIIDSGDDLEITNVDKAIYSFLIKKLAKLEIKFLLVKDILIPTDFIELREISKIPVEELEIADMESQHPLLLVIARQRKNLGSRWSPDILKGLSIDSKEFKKNFENMGGIQKPDEVSPLKITNVDKAIFSYLIQKIGVD